MSASVSESLLVVCVCARRATRLVVRVSAMEVVSGEDRVERTRDLLAAYIGPYVLPLLLFPLLSSPLVPYTMYPPLTQRSVLVLDIPEYI